MSERTTHFRCHADEKNACLLMHCSITCEYVASHASCIVLSAILSRSYDVHVTAVYPFRGHDPNAMRVSAACALSRAVTCDINGVLCQ